jgi:hypothetical protein
VNPADMMSGSLGVSPLFAKGLLYGFIVFVLAQGMMFLMSKIMPAPSGPMEGNMLLMMWVHLLDICFWFGGRIDSATGREGSRAAAKQPLSGNLIHHFLQ